MNRLHRPASVALLVIIPVLLTFATHGYTQLPEREHPRPKHHIHKIEIMLGLSESQHELLKEMKDNTHHNRRLIADLRQQLDELIFSENINQNKIQALVEKITEYSTNEMINNVNAENRFYLSLDDHQKLLFMEMRTLHGQNKRHPNDKGHMENSYER